MPGLPNFSVLSKDNASHWEPDSLIMTTTRFIPGQSLASFPLDNGYAPAMIFLLTAADVEYLWECYLNLC